GDAADFFERLIDRHGADGDGRVADDPVADVVDVAPGGEVHHRVGAPADRPHHLLDFLGHRGGDGGIADIGVDLHQEVAADDHRLGFGVVDVGGDDGAPARDFAADEFRRDEIGDRGAKIFAVTDVLTCRFAAEVFADGDEFHFRRDDPAPRIFELRDGKSFAI